jgi:acetylglutamate kinase
MQEEIQKAAVLIEALPYIQEFRNEIIVIKFGGSAMEDHEHVEGVLSDVTFMACVGMRPVIVHGGGRAISRGMKAHGMRSKFVQGLRVTCEKTIAVVEKVMKQQVNPAIVEGLRRMGAAAEGVQGEEVFEVARKTDVDPETGQKLDWGFVGEPDEVHAARLREVLEAGKVPVVTPLGRGRDGRVHNVNADTAAGAAAGALKARKLAFLSDVPGLLRDAEDPASVIPTLKMDDVQALIARRVISGGMLPKVRSGVAALRQGVRKVHMIDGRMSHSLLLEIFTDKGVGTEIVA